MSPRTKDLGPLEMEVVGLLHGDSPRSVAEIQKLLKSAGRDLAYTTVMTVLVRLHEKGLVMREKEGRQYLYRVARKATDVGDSLLARMRRTLFRNRKIEPILALLDDEEELSRDELLELKKAIDERIRRGEREK